jgi:2-hydroxychromene-2-carboxylate isomerase
VPSGSLRATPRLPAAPRRDSRARGLRHEELVFYFDPISPFAYLAFERLPQVLAGCSHVVEYRPVLLAGMLQHWGQKGPAEVEPKRAWTLRHVHWLAQQQGTALDTPR